MRGRRFRIREPRREGFGELADRLGCGRSKVSELRRLGVLDGAVVSNVGRKAIFDVETAMRLVSEYKMNK